MFIGKWNKSVILSYIGLIFGILGIYSAMHGDINNAFVCLVIAGVCDMFDGKIARACKRTEEEKQFGVQLDSLIDIVNFGAFPVVIYLSLGFVAWYQIVIYSLFMVAQVARLAYFNILVKDSNKDKPVKYYQGLPVTSSAIILPAVYLLSLLLNKLYFETVFTLTLLIMSFLHIYNFKVFKPKGVAYVVFGILALIGAIIYLVI